VTSVSPGAVVLGLAFPILFLHVRYQPGLSLPFGGTFKLQDAAVLAVTLAALVTLRREGVSRLRAGRRVWIAALLLLSWILVATIYPLARATPYAWRTHLVTAGEYFEYALLAPAVPLLIRRRADALFALGVVVVWAAAATGAAVLQVAGANILQAWGAGHRQPSFVGSHEFGGLAGMSIGIAAVGLFWGTPSRRVRLVLWIALGVGLAGFLLDASSSGIVGIVPAALVTGAIAARRQLVRSRWVALALALALAASGAVVALRAKDFNQFLRFAGVRATHQSTTHNVQTYSERTVLAYIGLKVWLAHPVLGAGWQATLEPATVDPVLPAAHRRFPDVAAIGFPTREHEYGIQLVYVQTLSDLGVIGLVLLLSLLVAAFALAAGTVLRAPPWPAAAATLGMFWLVLALGLFIGIGLVAGLPSDALFWLSLGVVAAAAAAHRPAEKR
jgi:O-Antigen ligase